MSQATSDEVEELDVTIIQRQQRRYRTRLEFWQRREQQLGSPTGQSLTDINPTDAQSTDLTAPRVGHPLPFKEGDLVVHIRHGRSRYGEIRLLDADGITKEYLQLEYAGGDRIYVPIEHLERVQKAHSRRTRPGSVGETATNELVRQPDIGQALASAPPESPGIGLVGRIVDGGTQPADRGTQMTSHS